MVASPRPRMPTAHSGWGLQQPVRRCLVHRAFLEVPPNLDVDELGISPVRSGEVLHDIGHRATEPADTEDGRREDDEDRTARRDRAGDGRSMQARVPGSPRRPRESRWRPLERPVRRSRGSAFSVHPRQHRERPAPRAHRSASTPARRPPLRPLPRPRRHTAPLRGIGRHEPRTRLVRVMERSLEDPRRPVRVRCPVPGGTRPRRISWFERPAAVVREPHLDGAVRDHATTLRDEACDEPVRRLCDDLVVRDDDLNR